MTVHEHPEYVALLRAVLADPADELPRVVFADWLDEHGEHDRAEFVRLQCRIAEMTKGWRLSVGYPERYFDPAKQEYPAITPELDALREREEELFNDHRYSWVDGLLGPEWKTCGLGRGGNPVRVEFTHRGRVEQAVPVEVAFRRGFPASIALSAEHFQLHERSLLWCMGKCGRCGGAGHQYAHPKTRKPSGTCPACSGSGKVPPTDEVACDLCRGTRRMLRTTTPRPTYVRRTLEESESFLIARRPPPPEEVPCSQCFGEGRRRVLRPFPATACPITDVYLTTHPFQQLIDTGRIVGGGWGLLRPWTPPVFGSDRWPGVVFHLPTATAAG